MQRIAQLYDLWYQDKQAARNVYDERPLERVPLSENPDFKPVRNAVVRAAAELDADAAVRHSIQTYAPPLLPMATRLLRQVGQIFGQQFQIDPPVARLADCQAPPEDRGEEAGSWTKIQYVDGGKPGRLPGFLSRCLRKEGYPLPKSNATWRGSTDLVALLRSRGETLKKLGSEWEWKFHDERVTIRGQPVVRPVHPEGRGRRGLLPLLLRGVGGTGGGRAA